jgi:DNA-binding NarL/FixJ family response regulator
VAARRLRVFIADDSFLIREGLQQVLGLAPEIHVQGAYADAPSLLAAVDADPPDVVVTDIRMPPTQTDEGMQIAARLRRTHPGLGVVVLSQHESAQYAAELLAAGAAGRGYLLKDRIHDLDHIVSTLQAVAAGECRIDTRLIDELVARRQRQPSPLQDLTPRQREILGDVAQGKSNLAIAADRGLTQRAVEKHVSEIFGRLGLGSDATISRRVHATLLYLAQRTP